MLEKIFRSFHKYSYIYYFDLQIRLSFIYTLLKRIRIGLKHKKTTEIAINDKQYGNIYEIK